MSEEQQPVAAPAAEKKQYERFYAVETPNKQNDQRFQTYRADGASVTDGCLILFLDKTAVVGFAPGRWVTFRVGFAPKEGKTA